MKRAALGLETIADWGTLAMAVHSAALGKSHRAEVRAWRQQQLCRYPVAPALEDL